MTNREGNHSIECVVCASFHDDVTDSIEQINKSNKKRESTDRCESKCMVKETETERKWQDGFGSVAVVGVITHLKEQITGNAKGTN